MRANILDRGTSHVYLQKLVIILPDIDYSQYPLGIGKIFLSPLDVAV